MKFRELKLRRDPQCPICGEHPTIKELIDYEVFCGIVPRTGKSGNPDEVTVQDMKKALDDPKLGIKVIDVREPDEYEIAHIDGRAVAADERIAKTFHGAGSEHAILSALQSRRAFALKAVEFLAEQGFKYVKSVKGGINAWSDEIDRNVPRY